MLTFEQQPTQGSAAIVEKLQVTKILTENEGRG